MIKFQQSQALTSNFESFWSIVSCTYLVQISVFSLFPFFTTFSFWSAFDWWKLFLMINPIFGKPSLDQNAWNLSKNFRKLEKNRNPIWQFFFLEIVKFQDYSECKFEFTWNNFCWIQDHKNSFDIWNHAYFVDRSKIIYGYIHLLNTCKYFDNTR